MRLLAVAAAALLPALAFAQSGSGRKVIDVRATQRPAGTSFEAHWAFYKKAAAKGDTEGAQNALREIRRLRIERNIRSLETLALARMSEGLEELKSGQPERAEAAFRDALALDPHLPDAHFGLALKESRRGPLGILPAVRHTIAGTMARFPTTRGRNYLFNLLMPVGLLAVFATTFIFGGAMILRYATLLRHDFEESFGPGKVALAVAAATIVLLLPSILFQGYGWLPLWWLAVLFIYMGWVERIATIAVFLVCIAVGPAVQSLDGHLLAQQNPLFWASLSSIETGPDARAATDLEAAVQKSPDDRDLLYLLATQHRKSGLYAEAAALYRQVLQANANDLVSLNNLANLEFAAGEYAPAIARYKQGIEQGPPAAVGATLYYNLSLAHLQLFQYQPAQEARSQADRLESGLVKQYDGLWKYDKGDYAVVDLRPSPAEISSKFVGMKDGVLPGAKNRALQGPADAGASALPALLNRFAVFPAIFLVVVVVLRRWRGSKMFTMRCLKCGAPFCRRCHLGAVAGGLCTQCHHLFVVRDGVSGPARNKKLLEVQKEDERRERVFRLLSLLAPGAGHLYAQKTAPGIVFVLLWSTVLAASLLAGRIIPVTEASSTLSKPWGLGVAAFLLLVIYIFANKGRPDFDVMVPVRRTAPQPTARRRAVS